MARVKIENAFGILKNRWGSLRGIHINIRRAQDHVRVLSWILSCFVLHNFLCDFENDEEWVQNDKRQEERQDWEEDEMMSIEAERRAGAEWRNQMREFFLTN